MSRKKNLTTLAAAFILGSVSMMLPACSSTENAGEKTVKSDIINFGYMDSSTTPGYDFFEYASGKGAAVSMIPATESRWGAFDELRDKNLSLLHKLMQEAANDTKAEKGSSKQLVGDMYFTGMDSAAIEKARLEPLKAEFARINNLKTSDDVLAEITHLQRNGISTAWAMYVDQDAMNSTKYALYGFQYGLGLPDKDYYFNKEARFVEIRKQYVAHIAKMFTLMGENEATAQKKAEKIMAMETQMASASMNRREMRDPDTIYNPVSIAKANEIAPNIKWDSYLKNIGVPIPLDTIIFSQPEFFRKVSSMLKTTPVSDWQAYLSWKLIHDKAGYLSSDFVNENFNFYGTVLNGVKEIKPRWKRVYSVVDNTVGMALGQEYVKTAFTPQAKERAKTMVDNLMAALKDRINQLEWMSDATKAQAMKKVNSITVKIGYPDKWKDYSGLEISRNNHFVTNIMIADSFENRRMLDHLGKPIDRTEWGMTPPTVNAYYNPSMNEIVFPAGILQPPFFNADADDAVNYGGIGAVIGHELTHGFDDQGRKFDAEGNMKDWWTEEDAKNFNARTKLIVDQFNAYKVPVNAKDSANVNGELTLGENIADLGGLTIAYAALQKALEGKKVEKIDGLTPEQRFFFSWAQVWRSAERPEFQATMVMTNPHSPSRFRVNGPLSNMVEFKEAFALKAGDKMVRPDSMRAKIW